MAEENLILDPGAAIGSSDIAKQTCNITLIYGSDNPDKGYNIPSDKIVDIIIRENFFLLLPTMTLKLTDVGSIFHDVNFQIGNTIYIKVMPDMISDDDNHVAVKPLLEGAFNIQAIDNSMDFDRDSYIYTFHCMYCAEKYLNDICVWPKSDTMAGKMPSLDKSFTSAETLAVVLSNAGLTPIIDFDSAPDDNMSWLNSTLTYSEFAKKIVSHAWISDDDMPLMYVDRNGNAYYTSLNTLCGKTVTAQYIHQTRYQKYYDKKYSNDANTTEKPEVYSVYYDINLANHGYLQNQGGYNIKKYVFNPYNVSNMSMFEFPPVTFDITNLKALTFNDTCFRAKDFKNNALRVGKISNQSDTQGETVRFHSVGTHFLQTHEYYDYAPIHHDSIKHAFFQQFAFLTISVTDQPGYAADPKQYLKLGDRISVDMTTVNHKTSVQSNNYIVTGLTHHFSFGAKYTIMATCASDGVGGVGQLRKQTKYTQTVK